jgi:hypothetical protein
VREEDDMRLEATVPDSRGTALAELCEELGLSRSQLIDEALALFLKAVLEVRKGRRLVTLDPQSSSPACELVTPTLAALEWVRKPQELKVSAQELQKMQELLETPPKPTSALREAQKRHPR